MKIAICMSGFIRTWEHTKLSFLKNLVQDHDCDVFVHTYKQNYFEHSARKNDVIYTDDEIRGMLSGLNVREFVVEDRDLIKPVVEEESKKFQNLQYYDYQIKESSAEIDNHISLGVRVYDQLRKIHLCNELRKNYQIKHNVSYDYIVKTRFDVLFIDKVNWNNFVDHSYAYNGEGGCAGYPDDLVGIGKEPAMNAYMDRFQSVDRLSYDANQICAHNTLIRNLTLNGFNIRTGGFRNRLLRNEHQILNWSPAVIDGQDIQPSKTTDGIILSGDNSDFDVFSFNKKLELE